MGPIELEELTIADIQFAYRDDWCTICVNGERIPLTITEYRLFRTFLPTKKYTPLAQDGLVLLSYLNKITLQRQLVLQKSETLRKHISKLNDKIERFSLQVANYNQGYILSKTRSA